MDEVLLPWLLVFILAVILLASCTAHRQREWTDADFGRLAIELGKQQRDLPK